MAANHAWASKQQIQLSKTELPQGSLHWEGSESSVRISNGPLKIFEWVA